MGMYMIGYLTYLEWFCLEIFGYIWEGIFKIWNESNSNNSWNFMVILCEFRSKFYLYTQTRTKPSYEFKYLRHSPSIQKDSFYLLLSLCAKNWEGHRFFLCIISFVKLLVVFQMIYPYDLSNSSYNSPVKSFLYPKT